MIFNIICDIIYNMFNSLSTFHACLSSPMQALAEPVAAAEHDSEENQLLDPDDASDYADQYSCPNDPDSPGSINDENLEILAAILKQIPECIDKANFDRHEDSARSDSGELLKEIVVRYHSVISCNDII